MVKKNITYTRNLRRNYVVLEPNYHKTIFFSDNLSVIVRERTQVLMNKPVYLGLSILKISKIVIYQFSMIT